ncbi:MAG: monovalent cation/H+ antiporter subunit D family protein [Xanthomonadales bacterium]|nr:monovalent cation/H+ antiporter subunit D family protein [Xanthomonadales bacterium]
MIAAHWLGLAVAVPFAGALLIALAGRWPNLRDGVSLATAVALFGAVLMALRGLLAGEPMTLALVELFPGLALALHTEPLSILFASLASGLWIVTAVYAIGYMRGLGEKHQTRFYCCFAVSLGAAIGVAFSANLLTLFVFYELLTFATYPLVAHKESDEARSGARTYLAVLLASSILFLLPAIAWTYALAGTLDFRLGGILPRGVEPLSAVLLLALFVLGTAKAAVMPVHRWLPAAMVAPTPVSALLHAVAVVKAGVFAIVKVVLYVFGTEMLGRFPAERLLVWLAGFTIVAASLVALRQQNLKRMLAYSTVGQLSYVVLATLVLTPFAEIGAALHIVAHAFGKITLFFAAGAIYVASKKTELGELGGIGRRMPITMLAFAIGALSMIGVPPTAGFASKWYIIAGAFQLDDYFVLAVITLSTGLNAAYFLPVVFRAFFREEERPPAKAHGEAPWPMVAALATTALLTLLFFFYNGPVVEPRGRPRGTRRMSGQEHWLARPRTIRWLWRIFGLLLAAALLAQWFDPRAWSFRSRRAVRLPCPLRLPRLRGDGAVREADRARAQASRRLLRPRCLRSSCRPPSS